MIFLNKASSFKTPSNKLQFMSDKKRSILNFASLKYHMVHIVRPDEGEARTLGPGGFEMDPARKKKNISIKKIAIFGEKLKLFV